MNIPIQFDILSLYFCFEISKVSLENLKKKAVTHLSVGGFGVSRRQKNDGYGCNHFVSINSRCSSLHQTLQDLRTRDAYLRPRGCWLQDFTFNFILSCGPGTNMVLEHWSPKIRETEMHVGTESGTDICFDQT